MPRERRVCFDHDQCGGRSGWYDDLAPPDQAPVSPDSCRRHPFPRVPGAALVAKKDVENEAAGHAWEMSD